MDKRMLKIILKKNIKILVTTAVVVGVLCGIVSFVLVSKKELEENTGSIGNEVNEENIGIENSVEKDGYLTIALFGLDAGEEGVTRSDTIMIANVNKDTGDIQLVSVCRDSFLYVDQWSERPASSGDVDYTKINHSYQLGVDEAIKALNQNFALHITDYVAVDFITVGKVIEAVGGIEVTLPDKANFIYYLNGMGRQAASMAGVKYKELSNSNRGKTVTLDGYQALGYCRVRKATVDGYPLQGESDFTRSARQQEVINKVIEKIKSEGKTNGISLIKKLYDICSDQKNMSTSFELDEILDIGMDAITKGYSLSEEGRAQFPFEPHEVKMWNSGMSTQFSKNSLIDDVRQLHALLYPDIELTDAELEKVVEISDQLEKYEKQYYPEYTPPTTATPTPTAGVTGSGTVSATANANASSNRRNY